MTPTGSMRCLSLVSCLVYVIGATAAGAQEGAPSPSGSLADLPGLAKAWSQRCENDVCLLDEDVEWTLPDGRRFIADRIRIVLSESRLEADGSVVFSTSEGQIAADRLEFDFERNTGTFHNARGTFALGVQADPAQFAGQDADVEFWGETIEKIGPRQYRLKWGGITTCVQPTPRWDLGVGSLLIDLDEHAAAWHTVLRVKNVPVMYLPWIRVPLQDDGRATGFLMPTYGTSSLRGQALSSAFFWVLGRSQDATITHDLFTRTGQGTGVEYRYAAAQGSSGTVNAYYLKQHEAQFTENGFQRTLPAATSFDLTGRVNHQIRPGVRAQARLDYFSDVQTQQLYQQDVFRATRNTRLMEGGLTAALGPTSTSLLYQRRELLSGDTRQLYGSTPRISTNVAPRRLFGTQVYGSLTAEYAHLPNRRVTADTLVSDTGYSRVEVAPSVRVPLSRLPYLSVNTSASYRTTRFSKSVGSGQATLDQPYFRQYASARAEIVGPVFNRIWDRPESTFAERLKHVVEPAFTLDFTSRISDYTRAPTSGDSLSDFVVSGAFRVTYGLNNRLFARGRAVDGAAGQAREFLTVGLQQTRYSNPESGRFDSTYQSTYGEGPREVSPVALTARVSPTTAFDANLRAEYDTVTGDGLRLLSAGGRVTMADTSTSLNYSQSRPDGRHALNASTTMRWLDGRATGTYAFTLDIGRSQLQSQTVAASYLAQCCGIQLEFQRYNFPEGYPLAADTRFNLGVVLAGLGTFSNFFGAFGGQQ